MCTHLAAQYLEHILITMTKKLTLEKKNVSEIVRKL